MEKTDQRVRGVMNLLLVWALVLFWVATVKPIDIHRNCLDLEISWNNLVATAHNGGQIPAPSLAGAKGPLLSDDETIFLQQFNDKCSLLSRYRYDSLDSKGADYSKRSAEEYIAACRSALDTAEEGAATNHPGLSTQETAALISSIERQLALLSWHVDRLELGPAATLADIAMEARPRISIPGSGLTIPMAGGVAWSLVGLSCVYLYLVSLLRVLREALPNDGMQQASDWLLLHPGLLGPLLGVVWLTVPLVALFSAGATVFAVQAVNTVSDLAKYFAFVLPASWLWCLVAAFRVRRRATELSRLGMPGGSPEALASDSDAWARESGAQARKSAERRLDAFTDTGISLESHKRAA